MLCVPPAQISMEVMRSAGARPCLAMPPQKKQGRRSRKRWCAAERLLTLAASSRSGLLAARLLPASNPCPVQGGRRSRILPRVIMEVPPADMAELLIDPGDMARVLVAEARAQGFDGWVRCEACQGGGGALRCPTEGLQGPWWRLACLLWRMLGLVQ